MRLVAVLTALLTLFAGCKSNDRFRDTNARDASFDGPDGSGGADGSAAGGADGAITADGATSGTTGGDGGDRIPTAFDGAIPDGATLDAAVLGLDAAIDLPRGTVILEDGAIVLPDGQVIDVDAAVERFTPEVDVTTCQIGEEDMWSTEVDVFDEGGFALVPGKIGFGLAYRGGRVGGCAQTLEAMPLSASSGFGEPRMIDTECTVLTDVSMLAADDGWRLAWVDNFTDMAELHTILLDADMGVAKGALRQTLTNNDGKRERKPVLRDIAGVPMAAWISEDVVSGAFSIESTVLGEGSTAQTVLAESAGEKPQAVALAQMGADGAALAWVGALESPGVWVQPLAANGAPQGEHVQLTERVAASSSVDMATRVDGGAVIYSIEIDGLPQVRFRRLDEHGVPLAAERSIVGPPLRGQGASLASLGGGYAVAYRAFAGGSVVAPEIRLTFVTKEGNVMRDGDGNLLSFHIGDATMAQGRTAVSVSVEGEIMVAWLDGDISTGRNVLKVVRRRLDCQ